MKITRLFLFALIILLASCKKDIKNTSSLTKIEGHKIEVNDSLKTDSVIEAYIKPYRTTVNKGLDSVLAYSANTYSKKDGELETAIGNFMADAVYEQANPIFKKRTGKNIDFVLLNHGGIRSIISKGNISARTAYQIMPFENAIVVVDLKGEQVKELVTYLANEKRAHPFSKLRLHLDKDYTVLNAKVNEKPIDYSKNYLVATNDYLYNGGNRMTFFKTNDSLYVLDYKIRNALIDYFKKIDTLNPKVDYRFTKLQ